MENTNLELLNQELGKENELLKEKIVKLETEMKSKDNTIKSKDERIARLRTSLDIIQVIVENI